MKKRNLVLLFLLAMVFCIIGTGVVTAAAAEPAHVQARSAYMMDADTHTEMMSYNATERLPIASMVKIMTALLGFEALDKGLIGLDETVVISDTASGMGGSQMFLDTGLSYSISDLFKGIIVVSANDASVAMAERIAGSESAFVNMMNDKAAKLGMNNTCFVNATGLPQAGQYSCAKDVATMLSQLVKHNEYYNYSKIWLEDYTHPDGRVTTLTNTNKLIRFYKDCDGGKTGFTNEAKFCLAASAKRGDMRLISVIIGADNSKMRFEETKRILNTAFGSYSNEVLARKGEEIGQAAVIGGKYKSVGYTVDGNVSVLTKRGETSNTEVVYELDKVTAEVKTGDKVGTCYLVKDGVVIKDYALLAMSDVPRANLGDLYERILGEW